MNAGTKYYSFTVGKEFRDKLVPVLDRLSKDRDRSDFICKALADYLHLEEMEALIAGVEDRDD